MTAGRGGRRVLVTGVSRHFGAALAERLESDPDVDEIVALDTAPPLRQLSRTEFVNADLRHALAGRLIRSLGIDTEVHAGTVIDTRREPRRKVHESNVIGTMNLLAACAGDDSPVTSLVVKSSTAVYPATPTAPALWTETMRRGTAGDAFTRDLEEMEEYIADFAARRPATNVTVLRFADALGAAEGTPFAEYLAQPVVPTVLGYDPRLQFVHESDVVDVLHRAVHARHRGIVNVAGGGIVTLSQAIAMEGRRNVPLIPPLATSIAVRMLRGGGLLPLPDHLLPLLRHGRGVDTTRLLSAFGYTPRFSSIDCVSAHAAARGSDGMPEPLAAVADADLEAFLHGRARVSANGTGKHRST